MKTIVKLYLFLLIVFLFNCLTIRDADGNDKYISEYREVKCHECGFINAVYINKDDYGKTIRIYCENCKAALFVSIDE